MEPRVSMEHTSNRIDLAGVHVGFPLIFLHKVRLVNEVRHLRAQRNLLTPPIVGSVMGHTPKPLSWVSIQSQCHTHHGRLEVVPRIDNHDSAPFCDLSETFRGFPGFLSADALVAADYFIVDGALVDGLALPAAHRAAGVLGVFPVRVARGLYIVDDGIIWQVIGIRFASPPFLWL